MKKLIHFAACVVIIACFALTLSACGSQSMFDELREILVPAESPAKPIENIMPTAKSIWDDDQDSGANTAVNEISADMAEEKLLNSLGDDYSADYLQRVKITSSDDGTKTEYYLFDVQQNNEHFCNYYVPAEEYGKIIDESEFRRLYFDKLERKYPESKAAEDLLSFLGNKPGITADYLKTVTISQEDYSGEVSYYQFSIKQGGSHIENYYTLATAYGGMIFTEEEFNIINE